MRTSGNVSFPSWDSGWVGGEASPLVGRCVVHGQWGRTPSLAGALVTNLGHTLGW